MKTAHTPTPWQEHNNIGRKCELGIIADSAPCIIATMANAKAWPVEAKANAEFIVRAVNNHDALMRLAEMVAAGNTEFDALEREARAALAAARKEGAK